MITILIDFVPAGSRFVRFVRARGMSFRTHAVIGISLIVNTPQGP